MMEATNTRGSYKTHHRVLYVIYKVLKHSCLCVLLLIVTLFFIVNQGYNQM